MPRCAGGPDWRRGVQQLGGRVRSDTVGSTQARVEGGELDGQCLVFLGQALAAPYAQRRQQRRVLGVCGGPKAGESRGAFVLGQGPALGADGTGCGDQQLCDLVERRGADF